MNKKEAVYILVGILGAATVWFLIVQRAAENDEDCGCNG